MRACALALSAGLAACGAPSWRDPATSHGDAAVAPEVVAAAEGEVAGLKPTAPAKRTTTEPLPAPPDWAAGLIGKPLRAHFTVTAKCIGNTDAVRTRYVGSVAGVLVVGWSWDPARQAAPPRVILVDDNFVIRGAGASGEKRPGLPKARPDVTSEDVGWQAVSSRVAGPLDVWGVLADGKTICKLGHIEL